MLILGPQTGNSEGLITWKRANWWENGGGIVRNSCLFLNTSTGILVMFSGWVSVILAILKTKRGTEPSSAGLTQHRERSCRNQNRDAHHCRDMSWFTEVEGQGGQRQENRHLGESRGAGGQCSLRLWTKIPRLLLVSLGLSTTNSCTEWQQRKKPLLTCSS